MPAVLGLNCFAHDTAACLIVDGRLVAFAEQERFNRDQHTLAFPDDAIRYCLDTAGIGIADLSAVAVAQHPLLDMARGAADAVRRGAPKRLAAQVYGDTALLAKERRFRGRWGYKGRLVHVGHHEAHAAGTFFASPFDRAAVLTLDRGGDFLSTTLGIGEGNRLRTVTEVRNPHSLGEAYTALTAYLGFRPNADEGKVMGLAPYGSKRFVDDFRGVFRLLDDGRFRVDLGWFRYQRQGRVAWSPRFESRYGQPRVPESELTDRDKDLAFAIQAALEDVAVHVARALRAESPTGNLCLSGGVALNSVMNMRVAVEAGFDEVFIQPAAGDAGNALGSALWVWHNQLGGERVWAMDHAYWGKEYQEGEFAAALQAAGLQFTEVRDPAAEAAGMLSEGNVVGWFQGRAEIGPRALGARSILADPRRAEMRDVVNHRVKRREWFRPFAPSVLDERGPEFFEGYRTNPFMLLVHPVRPEKQHVLPAVTHVDGTARLQSVSAATSPLFHQLISEFDRLTGVPVVLNTSFNLRGEPIVHRPSEAIADYLNSEMDALVMGHFLVRKAPTEP